MIGSTLGRFRITGSLGAGGMGVVYRARDESLGRDLAIKVLPAETVADPAARSRLVREARLAAALNHPNVCHVYEVGESDGYAWIAMELVEGKSLRDVIPADGLPTERVVHFGLQIAGALQHAHEHGVIHRDLKTANIMITPNGHAKVLDFGLAKQTVASSGSADTTLTNTGVVMGTPNYMPPEVLAGKAADERGDLWALGIVLYEMASGQSPFRGASIPELAAAIMKDPPAPLPPRVPLGLKAVITRCLAKEPSQRYQHVSEVRAALEALQSGGLEIARPRRRRALHLIWAIPVATILVMCALAFFGGIDLGFERRGSRIRSLAVLPLANLSNDPEQEYFADGMTEELITDLAPIGSLKVISRTSVMRYKGTKKSVPEIARELGVEGIVEGSVLRSGKRVRITAQLVDARNDRHLWAKSYERDVNDVLTLQSEVARDIARQIEIELTPQDTRRLATERKVNPAAYELYLKGRYFWSRGTDGDVRKAITFFERALELDRRDARSYAGLADAYVLLAQVVGSVPFMEALPKMKDYANRALELDPQSVEAHTSMAIALLWADRDIPEAERHIRRALELNPNYATAHLIQGILWTVQARHDEGIREGQRAVQLDPLSLVISQALSWQLYYARRFDDAEAQSKKTIEIEPRYPGAWAMVARLLERKGDFEEAIKVQRPIWPAYGYPENFSERVERAYAASGERGYWTAMMDSTRVGGGAVNSAWWQAFLAAHAGRKDDAFRWLERSIEWREGDLLFMRVDPSFDPLRDDPRFEALAKRYWDRSRS